MKETRFIAQNKEKWQESENLLRSSERDPEKLSNLFTQVIDDLSYSRTYYPNRSVRVYLNKIARAYFTVIYSHHRSGRNALRDFWLDELPQIVYGCRRALFISFIVFLVSVCIGVFSAIKDPEFTSTILGDAYVAMTEANIGKGDAMAFYKEGHQADMFLGITYNNLMVAFRAFVSGIFFSIGTVAMLLYNGIMVGCFQYFFFERGLFAESALAIWLHGTLEIASIILAGGAGLTLGSGLIFPGTYSRLQAFQISAMRSLKLMLGISPVFVLAALIESFLTRYTDVPDAVRLLLILLSGAFIVGYFVIYPWAKARKGFDHPLPVVRLAPTVVEPVSVDRIKSNAEILKDTFIFYNTFAGKIFAWVTVVTIAMTVGEMLAPDPRVEFRLFSEWWITLVNNLFYAAKTPSPLYIALNGAASSLIVYRVLAMVESHGGKASVKVFTVHSFRSFAGTALAVGTMYALICYLEGWGAVIVLCTFLFFLLFCFAGLTEGAGLVRAVSRTWKVCSERFGEVIGFQFILLMLSISFLVILSAPVLFMNVSILRWNFAESDVWSKEIIDFLEIFVRLFAFNLLLPVFAGSAAYLYFSLREVSTAGSLKRTISVMADKYVKG
ncbi:MAG TPA: stage II sporulation protein M [Chryseosolibacter sp.]